MKVIRNHFEGKPTILIHDRIINGCQDFTLEESSPILKKYSVPLECWKQVLDLYTGISEEEEIDQFVEDENYRVREAVAKYGNDKHRDQLINDENYFVRIAVQCTSE